MKRVVPGIHSVRETLKVRAKAITEMWIREGDLHGDLLSFLETCQARKIPVKRVSLKRLDREVQSHQGVLAFVSGAAPWPEVQELKKEKSQLLVALDSIEDPHNVGSLMRSAWTLGADGVMVSKEGSAGDVPSAQKVASGAFEHVPLLQVSNLPSELKSLKDLGFWIFGLTVEGESIYRVNFPSKAVLVVGSEESGLRKPVAGACDTLVQIPQSPSSASLNASVAGAIGIFEFLRQRNLSQRSEDSTKKI